MQPIHWDAMTPEDAIFELIRAAADGMPVLSAETIEPAPQPPYATLAVRWIDAGPAEEGQVDADGNQAMRDHRDATVELKSFGVAAFSVLDKLGLTLQHPDFEERAEALGLAVFDTGRLQNVPPEEGATFDFRRGALELGIRYSQTYTAFVGTIQTVTGVASTTGGITSAIDTSFTVKTPTAP
ncbi:hypothetical protein RAS12_00595 [Achromobacter seleniivolatilans]|uniref:Phage neck terminator protein gp12-like domain-containing protein n=1 Tax=Achromobacter seleniivolatilans TaxID=3047478 RepID=A0ABY9M1N1_9BURK|nr:hypothetical protein [Achromobacter sp. R39]WMD20902.1 hypothetical protein RAS12_00595 [Achromobacter sp. R39]